MRLTLKKVEAAREALQKAEAQRKFIKDWETAMKAIGDTGKQRVVAINLDDDDGSIITTECELSKTAGHSKQSEESAVKAASK